MGIVEIHYQKSDIRWIISEIKSKFDPVIRKD